MAGNSSIGVMPVKGMNKDLLSGIIQEGNYCYAMNMSFNGFDENGKPIGNNEASNLLNVSFPPGVKIIGYKRIPEMKRTIFMLLNPFNKELGVDGSSFIAEVRDYNCVSGIGNYVVSNACGCDNYKALEHTPLETLIPKPCTLYKTITSAACLNFNIDYPVRIAYDIIDCSLYLYFTDYYNERRFIYLKEDANKDLKVWKEFHTITGLDNCGAPIYSTVLDCNKIKIQPNLMPVCVSFIDEIPSGGLIAGTYQFFTALATPLGKAMTEYSPATNEIPIFNREITLKTNYQTNLGISIQISGYAYNTIHKYYNIVVAKTIDNVTSYELVATLPLNTQNFNYTGLDPALERLSENDVYQRFSYYKKADNVVSANGYLLWHGMAEYSKGNWQRIANEIKLNWQTTSLPLGSYKKSRYAHKYRSYLRDEVVPFGIIIGFTNGEETNVLHIPNRIAKNGEKDIVSNSDSISVPNCNTDNINEFWQVYNTATVTETPHQPFVECADSIWERGEFAYWESNRLYPNNSEIWGELCNTPIRHHKFPNCKISPLHDNALNGNNIIYPIGVVMDHISFYNAVNFGVFNGLITEEQKSRIAYYRIVRGNRAGNKSIIAKGLLYDMNVMTTQDTSGQKVPLTSKTIYYPNYPFNDLREDSYISSDYATYKDADSPIDSFKTKFYRNNRYTFHSPDTHFRQPGIGNILNIESLEYGNAEIEFKEVLNHAKFKFLTSLSYMLSLLTGASFAMSQLHKESKTLNRKDYWYNTTNDTDQYNLTRSEVYSNVQSAGALTVSVLFTTPGTMGGLTTNGSVSKTASWNVGKQNGGAPGNTLHARDYKGYYHLIPNKFGEETFTQVTGDKYDFLANPTGSSLHQAGVVYGEKSLPNPLVLFGLGVNRITSTMGLTLIEGQKILELIESIIPLKNLAIQYQAVGVYNKSSFQNVIQGNIRRYISDSAYLSPEIQHISEKVNMGVATQNIVINNWNRESSVFLKLLGSLLFNPDVTDVSRVTMSELGFDEVPNSSRDAKISSYYASIKRLIPDQYGFISDIEYVETGHCPFIYNTESPVSNDLTIFGGDTFINSFALKRKHSFFKLTAFNMPNESDWFYQDFPNVGFPNYYFNTKVPIGSRMKKEQLFDDLSLFDVTNNKAKLQNLLGVPKNRLDLAPSYSGGIGQFNGFGELFYQKGYIYTWAYGIPLFIVESDVNVDYRHGENFKEDDFYPRQKDLDYWLQEKNVSIREDNKYHYNSTYSKQNRLTYTTGDSFDFKPNDECSVVRPNELIYSTHKSQGMKYDPWLVYYPLDRVIFDNSNGALISVDTIESDKVLCRFENNVAIFNAYVTIQTSADTAIMGTGGMFQNKPQEFAKTDLGHYGTQHKALLKTEIGHIMIDAKRGIIWALSSGGQGVKELSSAGMRNWFRMNLPFQLSADFPEIKMRDLDNSLKGIGISMCHDKSNNRILITKKDYKLINREVKWDENIKSFYIKYPFNQFKNIKISVNDHRFFCNRSWTIGYDYKENEWISFYSFVPNFYIGFDSHFQSGLNSYATEYSNSSLWDHGLTNKSFQVFYGQLEPFEIDITPKADIKYAILQHVGFKLDVWHYHNEFDRAYMDMITFNKAIVYNERQCSGLLQLNYQVTPDLSIIYPQIDGENNLSNIEISKDGGVWYFNQFSDRTVGIDSNIPIMLHSCNNARTYINLKSIRFDNNLRTEDNIRSDQVIVRLINDKYSNYRFVLRWLYYDKQTQ
jgi:hypothetical protein